MRLDEIADWCLLEVLRRDTDLAGRLRGLRFQRHAISRVVDFAAHKDWGLLEESDYQLLLERYVPAVQNRYRYGRADRVWIAETKGYSHNPAVITATEGMAAMLMNAKQMKEYRRGVRDLALAK